MKPVLSEITVTGIPVPQSSSKRGTSSKAKTKQARQPSQQKDGSKSRATTKNSPFGKAHDKFAEDAERSSAAENNGKKSGLVGLKIRR